MNDREILELAAKAAGFVVIGEKIGRSGKQWLKMSSGQMWNALEDDGDALRLAATLKIDLEWQFTKLSAEPNVEAYISSLEMSCFCASEHETDYRRAIVRAAAEMGKAMP